MKVPYFSRNQGTKTPSPLLAHCQILREHFGDEIGIVFFGPCAAKKLEADRHPQLLDLALTFGDLRHFIDDAEEREMENSASSQTFIPAAAEHGRIYPIDGGMLETITSRLAGEQFETFVVSGLQSLHYYLEHLDSALLDRPVFLEALACEGGCINGPCRTQKQAGLVDRLKVRDNTPRRSRPPKRLLHGEIAGTILTPEPVASPGIPDEKLYQALALVGKTSPDDELNCGGCGYETCRAFARAIIEEMAEPSMCVSFMREKAQRKANALLRCMPSAAVIVNAELKIIECNRRFAEMFGEDTLLAYVARPGLKGAYLENIVPFASLFETVLQKGEDLERENLRIGEQLFNISLFTIDPEQVVGATIQDVTELEMYRDQIAQRANEVLQKNLATVQDIACRLGEHMADTEILLRSIAKGFARDEYQ